MRPSFPIWLLSSLVLHGLLILFLFGMGRDKWAESGVLAGGAVEIVSLSRGASVADQGIRKSHGKVSTREAVESIQEKFDNGVGTGAGEGIGVGSGLASGGNLLLTEIRKKIERTKQYPALAREQGVKGRVSVRFEMNQDGSVRSVNVIGSSGSALLDEAALATVRRASPYPYYAEPLSVTLEFSLSED